MPNAIKMLYEMKELKCQYDHLKIEMQTGFQQIRRQMEEEFPESLTQCILNRFQVNGAQPLLESRVKDMIESSMSALKDVLLSEIRSLGGGRGTPDEDTPSEPSPSQYPAGTLVDGYLQWHWGGRIHMVPEGWCLPPGNTRTMFNFFVMGNKSMQLRPYRFLRGYDLVATEKSAGKQIPLVLSPSERQRLLDKQTQTLRSYLSQVNAIMIVIEQCAGMKMKELANLSTEARDAKFVDAFHKMCKRMFPELSDEELDARRLSDNAFNTMYSQLSSKKMLRKQVVRKRKRTTDS